MKEASQGSNVMKSASEAARRTVTWSAAKQEFANRVIGSGSTGYASGKSNVAGGTPVRDANSTSGKQG